LFKKIQNAEVSGITGDK